MSRLREPKTGCPWDLRQDYCSITPSTLEEAYEVVDAIEKADYEHLREELGDLLFQVIFYCQLGQEDGYFCFNTVISDLVNKLIRRHPHVFPEGNLASRFAEFAEGEVRDTEAIKANWEALKSQEREAKGKKGIMDDVPLALPALSRAVKLQKRAASIGFDWPDVNGVIEKLEEEIAELKEALAMEDEAAAAAELGDVLLAAVSVARHLKLDAEAVLRAGNGKFEQRFRYLEDKAREAGVVLDEVSSMVMERWWEEVKENEESL